MSDRSNRPHGPSGVDLLGPADPDSAPVIPEKTPSRHHRGVGRVDQDALPTVFLVLVGVVTVGGLLLRLPSFNDSLFGDEISTYFIVVGNSLGRVMALVHSNQETTPPLYFVVAWATKGVLGSPVQSIRLVSLITGTAAIPLTFILGLWTVGRRAGLVGAVCVALSPYMIFFSTEARPYMLVMFLALLSTLALLRALDSGRLSWWVAYAACSSAAAYTHYTVVFLLGAQLAWALWTQPRARRALVVTNVAVAVSYLPWLGGLREDVRAPALNVIGVVDFHTIWSILESFWIGHPLTPIGLLPGNTIVVLAGAGLVVAVAGLAVKARGTGTPRLHIRPGTVLVVLLAVAPAVGIVLYSWARVDILDDRYLIASWPGLALAIGVLVTSPPKPWRWAAISITLAAYAVGGFRMLGSSAQRPDTDAAVAYIDQVGSSGDPIVADTYFYNPLSELDVALAGADQAQHHPVLRLGSPPLAEQLAHLSGPHPQPIFFGLPVTAPQVVARQAVALARNGTIFLFTSGFSKASEVNSNSDTPGGKYEINANLVLDEFLQALPARYHVVAEQTYWSFSGLFPQSVYVLRETGSGH